jgi:hypothetical protein
VSQSHNSRWYAIQLTYLCSDLWLSFARNSSADPVAGNLTWPRYSTTADTTVLFAADNQIAQLVNGSVVDDLCPSSTCPTCAYFDPTSTSL